jgi:hypothetical protein
VEVVQMEVLEVVGTSLVVVPVVEDQMAELQGVLLLVRLQLQESREDDWELRRLETWRVALSVVQLEVQLKVKQMPRNWKAT